MVHVQAQLLLAKHRDIGGGKGNRASGRGAIALDHYRTTIAPFCYSSLYYRYHNIKPRDYLKNPHFFTTCMHISARACSICN